MSQYTGKASLLSVGKKVKVIRLSQCDEREFSQTVHETIRYHWNRLQTSKLNWLSCDFLVFVWISGIALQFSVDDVFLANDWSLAKYWVNSQGIFGLFFLFNLKWNMYKKMIRDLKTYHSRWCSKLHQSFVRCPWCLYTNNLDSSLSRVAPQIAALSNRCHRTRAIFRPPDSTYRLSWICTRSCLHEL